MTRRVRFQRPIPGHPRIPTPSSLTEAARRAVEKEAKRFAVSKSFVVSVCVFIALGLDLPDADDYRKLSQPPPLPPRQPKLPQSETAKLLLKRDHSDERT